MRQSGMQGVFVTGTDTGVGKTLITGGLARVFYRAGKTVGVFKPFETGCAGRSSGPLARDAAFLKTMSGSSQDIDGICPYAFEHPLAPLVAARLEKRSIDMDRVIETFRSAADSCDFMLVEGVGGLLVPVTEQHTIADLAGLLELPLVIAARLGLGTINHTLLTVTEARRADLPVRGIVFNQQQPDDGPAERTNPGVVQSLCGERILGTVGYIPEEQRDDPDTIADAVAAGLDLDALGLESGHQYGRSTAL